MILIPRKKLPTRPALPGREFGEPWPRPIFPPLWTPRRDVLNMAGGIRFGPDGRVFTPRGLNFVNDDGTCTPCNCDNPPGSGRNTTSCTYCTGSVAPASILITFVGLTYASCSPLATPPHYISKAGSGYLGSCCIPFGGCGGGVDINDFYVNTWFDSTCSHGISNPPGTVVGIQYGPQKGPGSGTPNGWTVYAVNAATGGVYYWFYGFTETDGDCSTPQIVYNTLTIGATFTPYYGPGSFGIGAASGGGAAFTPQFMLC
jgi:hypothetical protein